jgi:hypothetical protein
MGKSIIVFIQLKILDYLRSSRMNIKKGLISLAASSLLVTGAFASSSITTTADTTTYVDSYTASNMGGNEDFAVQELGVSGFSASGYVTFKLSSNVTLDGNNTDVTEDIVSNTMLKNTTWLGTSASPKNLVVDLNGTTGCIYVFHADGNRTAIMSVVHNDDQNNSVYLGSSTSNTAKLVTYATLGDVNTSTAFTGAVEDVNITVGKIYLDATTDETVITLAIQSPTTQLDTFTLDDLNLSADANETGAITITMSNGDANGANGAGVTAGSLQLGTASNAGLRLVNNGGSTVPNVAAGSTANQSMMDFNLTAIAAQATDSNITLTISGATWASDANTTLMTDGNMTVAGIDVNIAANDDTTDPIWVHRTSDSVLTLELNSTNTGTNLANAQHISFASTSLPINTSAATNGSTVTVTVAGSTGTYSYVAIPAFTVANVVTDGVTVVQEDGNTSKYTTAIVVPGRTEQALVDINVSELFDSTFTNNESLTFTLPAGYTFSSRGTWKDYALNGTDSNTSGTSLPVTVINANSFAVSFATVDATNDDKNDAAGTVSARTNKTMLNLEGLKVNVPSTAAADEVVTLAVTHSNSAKQVVGSPINVGLVKTSSAAVNELNTTFATVSTSTTSATSYADVGFDVNETFGGILQESTTVTLTLPTGASFSSLGTCTDAEADCADDTTGFTVYPPTFSDSNKTISWKIQAAATTGDTTSGVRFLLPTISYSGITTPTTGLTATIAGSAGVAGSINLPSTAYGSTTTASSITSAETLSVDNWTGELLISEGIAAGLAATKGFKVVAPAGVVFTGKYNYSTQYPTSTTTPSYTAYQVAGSEATGSLSQSFGANDTLTIELPGSPSNSYVDNLKVKFQVNVSSSAAAGTQGFKVYDVNSSGVLTTSGLNLLYVGTIPTLTAAAAASVEAGATTSVVPTNSVGTVSYTSSDTAVATVAADGTVTVATDATAGATATITATDALTAQTATTVITVATPAPVEDALVTALKATASYDITGKYANQDMNADGDSTDASDWTFTFVSNNATYQLLGTTASDANPFGWASTTATPATASYYMVNLGDWDNDGNTRYDWIVVSTSGSVYKLKGANATTNSFEYETNTDGSVKTYNVTATIDTTTNKITFQ